MRQPARRSSPATRPAAAVAWSPVEPNPAPDLGDIVEALGSDRFVPQLLSYLNRMCGAEHCALFELGRDSLSELAAGSLDGTQRAHQQALRYLGQQYWRKDPAMAQARTMMDQASPVVIRVDVSELADKDLRDTIYPHISERIVICGRRRDSAFSLSILRSDVQGAFTERQVSQLGSVAELLVAVLAKHADVLLRRPNLAIALTSLPEIESCLVATTDLPRREMEVCARILFGQSSAEITADLRIGDESVKTYRKRAYQRLELGSERELLTWYLELWSGWQSRLLAGPSPSLLAQRRD
jgi:DNA-binding CsgD family transcriptional regulator